MPNPNPAPGRRTPVTVVQTDDDPYALPRRLGAAPLGNSIDLRAAQEPILPDVVDEAARALATADLPERRAAHKRREAELAAAVDVAAAAHHEVAELADSSAERRKQALDGAYWCEGKRALVLELDAELGGAQETVDVAARELAAAIAEKDALVAKQQGIAEEIELSHRQLIELEMAGRPEAELRRDLEAARQVAEEAASAAAIAERRIEELRGEVAAAEARAAAVADELRALEAALAADPAPVAAALQRLDGALMVPADVASVRLADDLERLTAELSSLPPTPPAPDAAQLTAAEEAAHAATANLEALRRPPKPSEPPSWWDELARLHAAVVDAESAAGSGGFGRKGAQRRLEEALNAERAFLVEIGYPSHLDALMSGGRPSGVPRPGPLTIAEAEQLVVDAEQQLFQLRAASQAAAHVRRVRNDLLRVRALGSALLGTTPDQLTPDRLRQPRIDPEVVEAAWSALAGAGVDDRAAGPAETARAWLTDRSQAGSRLVALTSESHTVEQALADLTHQVPGAESDVAEYATAATAARRRVAALESELQHRAERPLDPAERDAQAATIRQHIEDLERSSAASLVVADRAIESARARHAAADERSSQAEQEIADFRAHAVALRALLGDPPDVAADDLGALAAALRAEVSQLDLRIADGGRGVATAAAALAAARAAQAAQQSIAPDDPTAADRAAVLADMLATETRVTDLVVEPALGLDADGYELVLDELVAAGAEKPVVVITADSQFVAWAIEQPARHVTVVTAASVDPGLSMTDRIDKAQTK